MKPDIRRLALWGGPLVAAGVYGWMLQAGWDSHAAVAGAITLWCALWWIFEPVPIPATSLLPLGLFPLLGVMDGSQVAAAYGDPLIMLMLGGAMLSKSMEKCGAHRRIALGMVRLFGGGGPRRLVMGFMVAAAALSMWVSNTAATLMLLPVAMAVASGQTRQLAVALFLGIAYAASIGGLGTPIGSPPNVIFLKVHGELLGHAPTFMGWMGFGLPVVLLFLPLAGLWLTRNLGRPATLTLPEVGRWSVAERRTLLVFVCTALAWMTLDEPFGGWSQWLDQPYANYASVALIAVVALFALPDGRGGRLLDWDSAGSINWGVLLLFAGGITIAKAFVSTGISSALGDALGGLTALPTLPLMFVTALAVGFLTNVTSNTATATLLMPVLAAAGMGAGIDPILLMLPAAMAASCAFMLPAATAPNAIVFGSGQVTVMDMVREGLALNLMGAVLITLVTYLMLT